ncbi:hypothetical protein JB92DRAFT_2753638 [Gautieria morchelliformis]|nr:hypothetical protein JB92DRAFT_2753638 [Gautieria morchelliformis]
MAPARSHGDNTPENPRNTAPARTPGRCRVTSSNAIWGHVECVMRGTEPWRLRRVQALKPPEGDRRKRATHFTRLMEDLAWRNIANETGCWFFMGAQHPRATSPAIHYTSPKLMDEDLDGAEQLANLWVTLANALCRSRHEDALELVKHAGLIEKEKEALLHECARQSALLQEYQTRYGSLPGPPGESE